MDLSFIFLALMVIGWLFILVGGIMFLIAGFRESIVWGLAMLFLGGAAQLVFLFMHWEEAKRPFLLQVLGMVLFIISVGTAISQGNGQISPAMQVERLRTSMPSIPAVPWIEDTEEQETALPTIAPDSYVGRTLGEVIQALGEPPAKLKTGSQTTYLYPDLEVYSEDGVRVSSQGVPSSAR